MSFFSSVKSKALQAAAVVGVVVAAPAVYAQDAVTTFGNTVTALTADLTTYGGALVGVAAVGVAFMVGMKYIKKIRGAA